MQTKIITIDGTAASGKGTVARRLAKDLDFAYIDTGALYRLVAKYCLDHDIDTSDENAAALAAHAIQEGVSVADFENPNIRVEAVSQNASIVAAHPKVRDALLEVQKNLAKNPPLLADQTPAKGSILDGRDTGTVVCPNADIKFFVDADVKIRAERRYKELHSNGFQGTYDAVLQDMQERDGRDGNREAAPMKPADDAMIIDTSALNPEQVLKTMTDHVQGILS